MKYTQPTKTHPPSIIETERLILRTPRIEDGYALHELAAADPFFAHATVGPVSSTLETSCTAIARMLEDQRSGTGRWWIVTLKETGQAIGITGFSSHHHAHGPINALASHELGRGYAQEIIEALLNTSTPFPQRHDPLNSEPTRTEDPTPPTRWYWQNKPARSHRLSKRHCA